jgi:hypothetical protein
MIDKFISMGAKNINNALISTITRVRKNMTENINYLIDLGVDLNQALIASVLQGNIEAIKILIQRGLPNVQKAKEYAYSMSLKGSFKFEAKKCYDYLNSL